MTSISSGQAAMGRAALFVTGMQRAGTTLLERLLGCHPRLSVLSQPFPFVFLHAKRDFLRALGNGDAPFPLGDLFLEDRYTPAEFAGFLDRYRIDAATLGRLFEEMAGYSGQYTRFDPATLAPVLGRLAPRDFAATVSQLYHDLSPKTGADVFGGKETICEEFLPYLLDRGCACVLILRDPRDVLASLNYGLGPRFAGRPKPTLLNARNWRKSVAFALHLERHPRFVWVRYEDLVARPLDCLDRVAGTLGLERFSGDLLAGGVRDDAGAPWPGNSSHARHQGVSRESVGAYRRFLPADVVAYLEAVCYPELRHLGYPVSVERGDVSALVRGFREPYAISREGLEGYSTDPVHVEAEIRRAELLAALPSQTTRPYFLFEDVHERLRRAVVPG